MYRRWAYMVIAIIAAAALFYRPVLSFQEDKGIFSVRSFTMDTQNVYAIQTHLETGVSSVRGVVSVKGLYYCNKVMLYGAILCLLCFFSNTWRVRIATATALAAGAYYVLVVYYAMRITEEEFATFYPNLMIIVPAIVLQMMVMVRQNVIRTEIAEADEDTGD